MEYEIVRYRQEFKEGVLKLLEGLWGPSPALNAACLEWKYERNPYQSEPLLYLALHGGRVVGMRGMCGAKWEAGMPPEQFVIPCAADLVIAPEHRNRGVISKIMRFAFDDLKARGTEYVFNLSAGGVTFLNSLAMGWRSIGCLQKVSREDTREPAKERLKRFLGRWPPALSLARAIKNLPFIEPRARAAAAALEAERAMPFSRLDKNFHSRRGWRNLRTSLEMSPRAEAMADLVRRIGSDGRIRHVRDREYFAWRSQYPSRTYRYLYWGSSRLEGYLVLQATGLSSNGRRPRVTISDWEATSTRVFQALMKTAIRLGEFGEMVAWGKAVPRPAGEVLEKAGFRDQKESRGKPQYRPTVLVRATDDGKDAGEWRMAGNELLDASRWDVRQFYSL